MTVSRQLTSGPSPISPTSWFRASDFENPEFDAVTYVEEQSRVVSPGEAHVHSHDALHGSTPARAGPRMHYTLSSHVLMLIYFMHWP
jgi:hypothetical protein